MSIIIPQLALPKLPLGTPLNPFQETAKGLVFWWRGIPGRKAFDESGQGNHGTINGPEWVGDGLFGDGVDDYTDIGKDNFDLADITIICWITIDWSAPSGYKHIVSKGNRFDSGTETTFAFCVRNGGITNPDRDKVTFAFNVGGATRDIEAFPFAGDAFRANTPFGVWQQIAVTNTNGAQVIYYNGRVIGTDTDAGVPDLNNINARIGGPNVEDSSSDYFKGGIRDVSIYNRVLTPSEIQALAIDPDLPMRQDPIWLRYSPPEVGAGMAGIYYRTLLQGVN